MPFCCFLQCLFNYTPLPEAFQKLPFQNGWGYLVDEVTQKIWWT